VVSLNDGLSRIPRLGSGLGYRREIKEAIINAREKIDFLEIIADQFLGPYAPLDELKTLCELIPIIPHGISLSVGSVSLDTEYLRMIKGISNLTKSPYYSEHLAMTRAPGIDIGHLTPLWFTEATLTNTIRNVKRAQDTLEKPLVLENVTYLFEIASKEMTQAEFFGRLVESAGCGVLLDVTNVYTNSVNHRFDPLAFIKQMPLDHIVQIHLAGGYWANGILIDGHSEQVEQGSWELLEKLAQMIELKGSILEHDANFPAQLDTLLDQVSKARAFISPVPSA
jgi:uncharacterized protein